MTLLIAISAALVGASALAVLVFAGRLAIRRISERKLVAESRRIHLLLEEARKSDYDQLDKLLFDMRENIDLDVLDAEVRAELESCDDRLSERLLAAVSRLGITERYLDRVRNARAWAERARAATILASIGDPRAAAPLLEAMQDPREDRDVKLACAEALGRLANPEVIPILCAGLADVDEWSSPRLASVLVGFGDQAVEALLETLDHSPSLNGRMWSAQVLGKIGSSRAVSALLDHLHDRSEKMRLSVANALGDIGDLRAVRPLVNLILRDPIPAVRAQAASALGALGDREAVPILVTAMGDPEYWMRFRALEAIEVLAPEDITPIEEALGDSNAEVRRRAALALERLGHLDESFANLGSDDPARVARGRARLISVGRAGLSERFVRHLSDENDAVRENVALILGEVAARQHGPALARLLGDDNQRVVLAAVAALGAVGDPGTAGALVELLADSREEVRSAAAAALRRYPGKALAAISGALAIRLEDPSDRCRYHSTRVLAAIPGAEVDELLLARAARDHFAEVRLAAVTALGERGVTAAVDVIGDCLGDPYGPLRVAAADALSALGGERSIDLLLAAMPQADREQRDAICGGIAALGFAAIGPALDLLLGSGDDNARVGAAWTLGKTLDARAVPLLCALLGDSLSRVRSAAAGALAKIPTGDSIAALRTALDDPNQFVRAAVVNALGHNGGAGDLDALRGVLADPDGYVRGRAAVAIGSIGGRSGGERAYEILESDAGDCDAPLRALALGLCGIPAGLGTAVEMMRDAELRAEIVDLLGRESPARRERFLASVRRPGARVVDYWPGDDVAALLRPDELIDGLIDTLRNRHDPVARIGAVESLAQITDEQVDGALQGALLHDPHPSVRLRAAEILAARPRPELADTMAVAARDPHDGVRVVALRALGELRSVIHAGHVGPVLAAIGAEPAAVSAAAESAAAAVFARRPTELIDWLMGRQRPAEIAAGLRVLGKIGDPETVGLLQQFAASRDPGLRLEAVRALAAIDHPAAIAAMLDGLFDPDERVRAAIVAALPERPRAGMIERLEDLCRDPAVGVRTHLATRLGAMTAARAIDLLEILAGDHSVEVQVAALRAMLASSDAEGQERFRQCWQRLAPAGRLRAARDLSVLADALSEQLRSSLDEQRRRLAIQVLAALDPLAHAERIAAGLADPVPAIRLEAVRALSAIESDLLADWLRAVIDDPVAEIRAEARRLLIREV